jgi:hypothetical protein
VRGYVLVVAPTLALLIGCGGIDTAKMSCSDLGSRDTMHQVARKVLDEQNSPDLTQKRVAAYLAYACHGAPNQKFRPVESTSMTENCSKVLDGSDYVSCRPPAPGEFVRCYVSPSLEGCGADEVWPTRCQATLDGASEGRFDASSDFVTACETLIKSSHDGASARRAFPF